MGIRNTLIGAGLLGILGAQEVQAAGVEDTGNPYAELSRPALTKSLQEKAVVLTDRNYKTEVLDYDGAVLVLFDSTCTKTQEADNINRNMDIVYLGLIDKFDDIRVNGLPLKFASFDGCGFYGRDFFKSLGVTTTETHMYLDGREIDKKTGGPLTEDDIGPVYRNMANLWIPLNLTEPNDGYTGRYNGTSQLVKVQKK
ncbi:MAG: hypothetical protein Q8R18_03205 [bacterium]|nr:hypothetical protein [bacterium]